MNTEKNMKEGLIQQLADELAIRVSDKILPSVPVKLSYWGLQEIAACLGCSTKNVSRMSALPDFPTSYRFPTGDGSRGHRRWLAKEIIDWAETYRNREAGL